MLALCRHQRCVAGMVRWESIASRLVFHVDIALFLLCLANCPNRKPFFGTTDVALNLQNIRPWFKGSLALVFNPMRRSATRNENSIASFA